jgi:hypothetical protein
MNISRSFVILLVVCVGLLAAQTGWAQTTVAVKIYCAQVGQHDSVTIGVAADGSNTTNAADSARGEAVNFPPPGPGFDFRCESNSGVDTLANDPSTGGSYVNYHKLVYDTQKDIFKLGFKPDDATSMTISWPTGLAGVGAGYWVMKDDGGATTSFTAVDMTTAGEVVINTDPLTFPPDSRGLYHVYIVKGDAAGFRTATPALIVGAVDNAGKAGKVVKYKPYNSIASFTIPAPASKFDKLHVEFGQGIVAKLALSANATTASATDGKNAKFDFVVDTTTLAPVTMTLQGAKGKDLLMKSYYWTYAVPPAKFKPVKTAGVTATSGSTKLLYYMPDWINLVNEVYAKGLGTNGLYAGINAAGLDFADAPKNKKPAWRFVYLPKASDFTKTLGLGKGGPATTPGVCFQTVNSKIPTKAFKGLTFDKGSNNLLYAELVTLRFNLFLSDFGFTSTGLRTAKVKASALGVTGLTEDITLDQLTVLADSVLACRSTLSPVEFGTALHNLNLDFSGPVDTVGDWATQTHLKPVKMVADQSLIYRTSLTAVAPLAGPSFNSLPEEPVTFSLNQNYPNPFNPTTTIEFSLAKDAFVTLKIYNVLGQEVASLINHEQMDAGQQTIDFNGQNLASGVYYYRLIVNDGQFQQVKKMMLVK